MAFTPDERNRIRVALGYMSVGMAASMQLGIPRPAQTLFLLEDAMTLILPQAEDRCRRIVETMENIECQLAAATANFAVSEVDGIKLRENQDELLERNYVRWGKRLADVLGVPIYPYSERYNRGSINRSVVG